MDDNNTLDLNLPLPPALDIGEEAINYLCDVGQHFMHIKRTMGDSADEFNASRRRMVTFLEREAPEQFARDREKVTRLYDYYEQTARATAEFADLVCDDLILRIQTYTDTMKAIAETVGGEVRAKH